MSDLSVFFRKLAQDHMNELTIKELFDDIKGPLTESVQFYKDGNVIKVRNPLTEDVKRKRALLFEKIREKINQVWKDGEFTVEAGWVGKFYVIVTVQREHVRKMWGIVQRIFSNDIDILVDSIPSSSELDRLVARLDNVPIWKRLYNYFFG